MSNVTTDQEWICVCFINNIRIVRSAVIQLKKNEEVTMADKQRHKVNDVTRREFIRDGALAAAGLADDIKKTH